MDAAPDLTTAVARLPVPFRHESFRFLRRGIHDSNGTDVYVTAAGDFAFLHPIPVFDYTHYKRRKTKLGLDTYQSDRAVAARRLGKIAGAIPESGDLLEIGASRGAFLSLVQEARPRLRLASLEKDLLTKPDRDAIAGLQQFSEFEDLLTQGHRFDIICLFHVLEHIVEPQPFLANLRKLAGPQTRVVIEVPSLDDPLLSVYKVPAYSDFFFQCQHPYTYTAKSLGRLLEAEGFIIQTLSAHQRYGLENHLAWLQRGQPGGDPAYREIFADGDDVYRECLERTGKSDAVIAVATPAA